MPDIGKLIKEARIANGMTQEELGKIIGVQKSAIAKYENGRVVNIKRSTLQKLSQTLGLKGSDLIATSNKLEIDDTIKNSFQSSLRDKTDEELLEAFRNAPDYKKDAIRDLLGLK